jgi:hypothetical protein
MNEMSVYTCDEHEGENLKEGRKGSLLDDCLQG